MKPFQDSNILITGGTGSLGGAILNKILDGQYGLPEIIRIFSRDEAKQAALKKEILRRQDYEYIKPRIQFFIGDIRNYPSVHAAVDGMNYIIHAAAMKHVPECEENPEEAVYTNCLGASNIVKAVKNEHRVLGMPVRVIALTTDKACEPFSLMGMTKAIQERIFVRANAWESSDFMSIRMGNMLMSRGSVIPLFKHQVDNGLPITVTHPKMTRFFIPLKEAAEQVIHALRFTQGGQTYVPKMYSAEIFKIAQMISGKKDYPIEITGMRPGEKIHDTLISKAESRYAKEIKGSALDGWLIYPSGEFSGPQPDDLVPEWEYSSKDNIMEDISLASMISRVLRIV